MIQTPVGTHLGDQRIDRKWSRDTLVTHVYLSQKLALKKNLNKKNLIHVLEQS